MGLSWTVTPDSYARPMLVVDTNPPPLLHRSPQAPIAPTPPPVENLYPEMGPLFQRWST